MGCESRSWLDQLIRALSELAVKTEEKLSDHATLLTHRISDSGMVLTVKRLLLLSGPMAGGKSSVSAVLQERYGFLPISSGAFLRSQLAVLKKPIDRHHLQDLGDALDKATNFLWLIDLVARPAFDARPQNENWLVDAVRKPRQVELFRNGFTGEVRHVHVVAPEDVLQQRYASRSALPLAQYRVDLLHPNEQCAHSLAALADQILDTNEHTSSKIAELIMGTWET